MIELKVDTFALAPVPLRLHRRERRRCVVAREARGESKHQTAVVKARREDRRRQCVVRILRTPESTVDARTDAVRLFVPRVWSTAGTNRRRR